LTSLRGTWGGEEGWWKLEAKKQGEMRTPVQRAERGLEFGI